jgi:cation diffusion facilitator family transporter
VSAEGGTKAVVAALAANLGIAATKFAAFALTGSSSMLAESIHSVADSGNQGLLLLGGRRATREATARHPFGYGRERYIYAFIVAVVLFFVGGVFAAYEAWHKFQHPEAIESWHWVPIAVLVVAICLESLSFRTAIRETNKIREGMSWVQFIRRARVPELPVILLEDFAALIGLVLALFGVGLTLLTGNGIWDAAGTAAIALLLIAVAAVLAVETKSLLLGESATPNQVALIERALVSVPEVECVIHMRTVHIGPEELLVAAKIGVRPDVTAEHLTTAIDVAEASVRAAVPIAKVIYLEPDIYRPERAEGEPAFGATGAVGAVPSPPLPTLPGPPPATSSTRAGEH